MLVHISNNLLKYNYLKAYINISTRQVFVCVKVFFSLRLRMLFCFQGSAFLGNSGSEWIKSSSYAQTLKI